MNAMPTSLSCSNLLLTFGDHLSDNDQIVLPIAQSTHLDDNVAVLAKSRALHAGALVG